MTSITVVRVAFGVAWRKRQAAQTTQGQNVPSNGTPTHSTTKLTDMITAVGITAPQSKDMLTRSMLV
jgi:hypothetical protein